MLKKTCLCFLVMTCFLQASLASIAPFIKACLVNDNDCLLAANTQIAFPYLADGIPELGMPPAEPMRFANITLDEGYFKLQLLNMNIAGFSKCKLTGFKRNEADSSFTFTLDCPFDAIGNYKFNGKIGFFNVDNTGDFKILADSIKTTITTKAEKVEGADKKTYWNLSSYDFSYEPIGKMHIDLGNLFSGDIDSNQPFLSFFNKNWWSSVSDIGKPIASSSVQYFFEVLQTFFLRVPIENLEY